MAMTTFPEPTVKNFDEAAKIFFQFKPIGIGDFGLAILQTLRDIRWSVSYAVLDPDYAVDLKNLEKITRLMQKHVPPGAKFHSVKICYIKPGGLVQGRWQVTYT